MRRVEDVRDAWSLAVETAMQVDTPVTVCVGVICDASHRDGPTIILAADDKSTYGDPPLTTDKVCGKIHDFQPICDLGACISGSAEICDAVIAEFHEQLKAMKQKEEAQGHWLATDHVRLAIREARHYEYGLFADDAMQGLLHIGLDQWRTETNPEIRRKGMAVMRAAMFHFPIWIIFGGFLHGDWVLTRASGATVTSSGSSHYAVGIGQLPAYKALHRRKHDYYSPYPAALVHVAEAMEAARKAYPKYIGKPADYLVLRRNQPMMRFRRRSPLLEKWLKAGTKSMVDSEELRRQFDAELYPLASVNPQ
jgi:hypothetical protein